MHNRAQGIGGGEAPDRSGAIDGCQHRAGRVEEKTGCMQVVLLRVEKCSRLRGDLVSRQAIGDGESELFRIDHLLGIFLRVRRDGDDFDLDLFERANPRLIISQLLMADRSPHSAIDEQNTVGSGGLLWESLHAAIGKPEDHFRETIACIEAFGFKSSHFISPLDNITAHSS